MAEPPQLKREITLPAAVMLGLGSIVGTGIFVSIGVAAGVAGAGVLPAIVVAGLLAICNGLSSAQLAAAHPVSGGTYEYGYRWLTPLAGFVAGWLFLCAKVASAATAALGLAAYLQTGTALPDGDGTRIVLALTGLGGLTLIVVLGIRRTTLVNTAIVGLTLAALLMLVTAGLVPAMQATAEQAGESGGGPTVWRDVLAAAALMFVSFTGYGRIATLGEEVRRPRQTIPRAMIVTLVVTLVLYLLVGLVAVGLVGPTALAGATADQASPLWFVATTLQIPWLAGLLSVAAITAMLGVVLNLLLGISRVVLAMARRGDMPRSFSRIDRRGVPLPATLLVSGLIAALVLIGDIRVSWSFSAVTVLVYYGMTNGCVLRMAREERLYPAWIAWCGLAGCFSLALFVEPEIGIAATIVTIVGLLWRAGWQRLAARRHR